MDEHLAAFRTAVASLETQFGNDVERLVDTNVQGELHSWLDGNDEPLEWTDPGNVTADEWFFITTLYGQMTLVGQRAHIRRFYPDLFVRQANRDVRNFTNDLQGYAGLRGDWMKTRLCKMASILRERRTTMSQYVEHLRTLERTATPENPSPALEAIKADHQVTGWKTLSVFVRDCVGGNCFPIDSRVEKELRLQGLPVDEDLLIRLSLTIGKNPRQIARMFYESGGQNATGAGTLNVLTAHSKTEHLVREGRDQLNDLTGVEMFVDNDAAYIQWLAENNQGYVINSFREPSSKYLVLHKATCHTIKGIPKAGSKWTVDYCRICAVDLDALEVWTADRLKAVARRCKFCFKD